MISLTAAPVRADRQELPGEIVYRYSLTRAMSAGYAKPIRCLSAAPEEIYFTATGQDRRYSLEEVLELSEEAWARDSVALSPECNRHIVDASIAACNQMRQRTGTHHQVIASACSIDHARQIRSIYEERGYRPAAISSSLDLDAQEQVLRQLRNHQSDCIVQWQALDRGFDHPALSVAAIFRPYRLVAPYIKFVGRVMRMIHHSEPDHPDNRAVIVTHAGLNDYKRWEDIREVDPDDQDLFRTWTTERSGPPDIGAEPGRSGGPGRFDDLQPLHSGFAGPIVDGPIVDGPIVDLTDDRVLDEILNQEILPRITLGSVITDKESFRSALIKRQAARGPTPRPTAIPADPQQHRQEVLQQLARRTHSAAAQVLVGLGLAATGREFARFIGSSRQSNRQAAIALIRQRVNAFIGSIPGKGPRSPPTRPSPLSNS